MRGSKIESGFAKKNIFKATGKTNSSAARILVDCKVQASLLQVRQLFLLLPFVRQQARETPVFVVYLLNNDMRMLWFFAKNACQGIGNLINQLSLLLSGGALCDLNIYIWHVVSAFLGFVTVEYNKKTKINIPGQASTRSAYTARLFCRMYDARHAGVIFGTNNDCR